jgi:hypothetical protein
MARTTLLAAFLSLLLGVPALAGEEPLPQVTVELPIATAPSGKARSLDKIEQGDATIRTAARNQKGGETVQVDLTLDYRVPKGTIALDELVDSIVVETLTPGGLLHQRATIATELITLNPNRAKLEYRVTLFYPTDAATYLLRVRVFGNYE